MTTCDALVDASLVVSGLDLEPGAVTRIKIEFARIAAIAAVLDPDAMPFQVEPASIYHS